ncbi:chromatin remodelling complex Rsc7/Swp82 subunit-domain-containing protein [Mycotypha africana]|uniref:chromatin remodelling complex Rsc7/Swp82 subunit-domain-containing protein n=1 Tax=Mycotypha africana TaxID=64632 RepID=UPI002301FCA3|nr:chromatin remodelling complex Rsc7/Swp82 subunit-domain-containing protein [Mycotypha africana]KAI8972041.1 chromatin remodelling complex Rsc7/Swp82 subunit-domain-containing protein [Mycotypha africana]
MDPTKLLGFRDSYLFFQKNPTLKRVRITEDEKKVLVDMGLLVHHFKHRDVAVVTARSVFKRFGYRVVKRGKRFRDDYYENAMQDDQFSSTPASVHDAAESDSRSGRRNNLLSSSAASVYDEDTDSGQNDGSRKSLINKSAKSEGYASNAPLNQETWMHHAALAARSFNAQLHERRSEKPVFYDIHTNVNQLPSSFQTTACHFEFTKGQVDDIEFKKKRNDYKIPLYRGFGKNLLDLDMEKLLKELPDDIDKERVKEIVKEKTPYKTIQDKDDYYPLSLMEGQFQANFAVHQTRFNFPAPKVPDPGHLLDTAQSLTAQQHYLGLVYQAVNQFADPQRQALSQPTPPPAQLSMTRPQNFTSISPQQLPQHVPTPPQMMMQQPPPPQRIPSNQQQQSLVCGIQVGPDQFCTRLVNRPGEPCPLHAPAKQMSDFAKGPPPKIVYSDNKCAECHQLKAPEEQFKSEEEHITDDFTVVKCSKCTRKYHPICANLTTPRQLAAVESYPWLCPECKICCVCKSAGDESTLMICDGCDRGWHTGCCSPPVEKVPEGSWLCSLCANCHSCNEHGMGEESQYTHAVAPKSDRYKYPVYLATYCPKCILHFNDDRFCPACLKTYSEEENNEDEDNEMVACDNCDHWVHTRCDESLTPERYQVLCDEEEAKYTCPMCEDRFKRLVDTSTADLALKGLSAPSGYVVGLLGGKVKTRGIVKYKDIKIGVPEINGTGIAEMPATATTNGR